MVTFWATFWLNKFIAFSLKKQFQNIVARILGFQKWFDIDVLAFQMKLCCRYFGIFWLGDCLGYFLNNWAIFFSKLLVTLFRTKAKPMAAWHWPLMSLEQKSRRQVLSSRRTSFVVASDVSSSRRTFRRRVGTRSILLFLTITLSLG